MADSADRSAAGAPVVPGAPAVPGTPVNSAPAAAARAAAPATPPGFGGLLACLVLSGMSGLIYEVCWVRSLELVFGATSFAVATVLAAFMGGLALGSFAMGQMAHRLERFSPLSVYAVVEALIGIVALAVPALLEGLVPLYQLLYSTFHASFAAFSVLRFLLCGAILLVPTVLMGATLPIASRFAAGEAGRPGRAVGLLYACNTLGAVLGCAGAGIWLLPALGLERTQALAVGLNLLAALGAVALARYVGWRRRRAAQSGAAPLGAAPSLAAAGSATPDTAAGMARPPASALLRAEEALNPAATGLAAALLVGLYAVSGAAAMTYEVAWSRFLVLILGSSTYSYTIMLTTFLLGLALGASLGSRVVRGSPDPLLAAGVCQILTGLSTFLGLFVAAELPYLYVLARDRLEPSPAGLLGLQLLLAGAVMFLPTLGLGAMFPVTIEGLNPRGRRVPRIVGWAYAWNTGGAIAGSLLAGFWLVPRAGTRNALVAGVVVNALLGLLALLAAGGGRPARAPGGTGAAGGITEVAAARLARRRRVLVVAVALFALNAPFAAPRWRPEVLSSGIFRYAERYQGMGRGDFLESVRRNHGDILLFEEGLTCTVTVFRNTETLALLVNGKPDASGPPGLADPYGRPDPARIGDMPTQVLLAQIPLLLAPRTDRVLVVGLGSGVTLGSVLRHPVREVECAELEKAVVRASRFYDDQSGRPLDDRRVRLVVNDARNHLLVADRPYDVIISEPSNPWVAGAAGLFTREFFDLARRRLGPQGIFCQWIQLYELRAADFRAILRSFAAAFPQAHLFRVEDDAILVGSVEPLPIRLESIRARGAAAVLEDLDRIGIASPIDLLAHYWIGGEALSAGLPPGPVNTDDNMLIEFAAPLRMLARAQGEEAAQKREIAALFAGRETGIAAHLELPEGDAATRAGFWARMAEATLERRKDPHEAARYAALSLRLAPNPVAERALGEALHREGRAPEARERLRAAAALYPRDADLPRALASLCREEKDWGCMAEQSERVLQLVPADSRALYGLGEARLKEDDAHAALEALRRIGGPATIAPAPIKGGVASGTAADFPDLPLLHGTAAARAGLHDEAIPRLETHLRRRPGDRDARALLAEALRSAGRATAAEIVALPLEPDAAERAEGLLRQAEGFWYTGDTAGAIAHLEEARQLDPASDDVAFLLAQARARAGERDRTIGLLEEVLAAFPDRPWAVGYLSQLEAAQDPDRAALLAARYVALTGRRWEALLD